MYQTFGLERQWSAPRLLLGPLCPSVLLLTGVDGAVPDSDGWWFDLSNALGPSTVRTEAPWKFWYCSYAQGPLPSRKSRLSPPKSPGVSRSLRNTA